MKFKKPITITYIIGQFALFPLSLIARFLGPLDFI